jgi:hypothetical protein
MPEELDPGWEMNPVGVGKRVWFPNPYRIPKISVVRYNTNLSIYRLPTYNLFEVNF